MSRGQSSQPVLKLIFLEAIMKAWKRVTKEGIYSKAKRKEYTPKEGINKEMYRLV